MDRASGSGVFARDPDALLDLIELELPEKLLKQEENKAACSVCEEWLKRHVPGYEREISQDDPCSEKAMWEACERLLQMDQRILLQREIEVAKKAVQQRTAWRIDGTLREFPKFPPVNLWFTYPVHAVDTVGSLKDVDAEGEAPFWKKGMEKRKLPGEKFKERKQAVENAFEASAFGGQVTVEAMAEYMGVTEKTVRNRLKEHGGFLARDNIVERKRA